ncbi:MAG TPA: FAD-linked oxidase C-terminal domain-containing protein, partial [Chitinophagales bacterium]|nr:FAD-linked oxidase C-terminal domain-containing protein [Chitinophagales bacterium]
DHVLELKTILSDGSDAVFTTISHNEFEEKCKGDKLENQLYRQIKDALSKPELQLEIRKEFPKPEIHRRNTGYAVDILLETSPFTPGKPNFNFCKLLAGSEGTLAFITEIKLNCVPLPPKEQLLVCIHFNDVDESLRAVLIARKYKPRAIELMDKIILDCTKENLEQRKNRFFLQGDPGAILIVEFGADVREEIEQASNQMIEDLNQQGLGIHFPKVYPPDTNRVWKLREAGLGSLSNVKGDRKPVAVIEDTAVRVEELPQYISEFSKMMEAFGQKPVYYAHAGAGELHIRPILNLKDREDVRQFREIATASAKLVKKYGGSLSGEHGDGRVRAEFIPLMVGEKNYQLLRRIKQTWDPNNIFNPGKIVDAPPMNTFLRYDAGQQTPQFQTLLDFSDSGDILRAAERCNGAGDCRKLAFAGGTMCPSYMATRNEKDTTRARANVLREFLTRSTKPNRFDNKEIYDVMDLCLSCKGCKSECPSNVDMAALKAEFLHHYYKSNKISFRTKAIASIASLNRLAAFAPAFSNFIMTNAATGALMKKALGIAVSRSLPLLHAFTLKAWFRKNAQRLKPDKPLKKVYFFCDEFSNYNDVEAGMKAIELLSRLNYEVLIPEHAESGRAYISKGMLPQAKKLADKNVGLLKNIVTNDSPLLGIEPSALLSFRDEYPRIVSSHLKESARQLQQHVFLIDEFLSAEIQSGNISRDSFTKDTGKILLHGHCHQKALSNLEHTVRMLSLPQNYKVEVIPSGCCGMAGSFGYEAEHYDVSMKIGEMILFPAVRKADKHVIIAAPGTSCRHQIWDGTRMKARHPVEILWRALL